MEFRLLYKGPLSSHRGGGRGGSILKEKHSIRRQLHPQLQELWEQKWHLKRQLEHEYTGRNKDGEETMMYSSTNSEAMQVANRFREGNFRFLPLVTKDNGLACKLNILFLRRDAPGNLIESGGDIDNRIKVLFDALSVPGRGTMADFSPEANEDPLFCLLEDDQLVTEVTVITDRLLMPLQSDEHIHDVVLIISVTVKVIDANAAEFEFLGE